MTAFVPPYFPDTIASDPILTRAHPPPDLPSLAEQLDSVPEERLVFALADGRGGVLAVRGKRITDTRPTRPTWGFLSGPECVATAVAGWGPYVFLGDAEGTLMRWDVSSGRLSALLVGGQGAVKQLHCAPLPANALAAVPSAGVCNGGENMGLIGGRLSQVIALSLSATLNGLWVIFG